jgi:hypothetical protein
MDDLGLSYNDGFEVESVMALVPGIVEVVRGGESSFPDLLVEVWGGLSELSSPNEIEGSTCRVGAVEDRDKWGFLAERSP